MTDDWVGRARARHIVTGVFTVAALSLCASPRAFAQDDDDLLGGLGGDAEPTEKAPAKPIEEMVADDQAEADEEADVDIDTPLEEMKAAPPSPKGDETSAPVQASLEGEAAPQIKDKAKDHGVEPTTLDRIKAVQRKPVLKQLRVEITPMFGVSLNDAFYTHMTIGGTVIFYPHDSFGVGASGTFYLLHARSNAHKVVRVGQTAVPAVFSLPTGGGSLDLYWSPIYGKISLADSFIVPFDFYAVTGIGLVVSGGAVRPSFKAGIGERLMINDFLALRLEAADTVFNDTQEVNGQPRSDIQNYFMLTVGLSIFVPPTFDYAGL